MNRLVLGSLGAGVALVAGFHPVSTAALAQLRGMAFVQVKHHDERHSRHNRWM